MAFLAIAMPHRNGPHSPLAARLLLLERVERREHPGTAIGFSRAEEQAAALNRILRLELSALAAYGEAIEKAESRGASDMVLLKAIAREHAAQTERLRDEIWSAGAVPTEYPAGWVEPLRRLASVTRTFADGSAVAALRDGERELLEACDATVAEVDGAARRLLAGIIAPAQRHHVATLDGILLRYSGSERRARFLHPPSPGSATRFHVAGDPKRRAR